MTALFTCLLDIFRLRRNPQDLPASWSWVFLLLVANIALGIWTSKTLLPEQDAGAGHLADWGFQFLFIYTLLSLRGLQYRSAQTLLAFTGTGLLLSLILMALVPGLQQPEETTGKLFSQWALLGLLAWSFAVDGHIFRHALSTNMLIGVSIALASFVFRSILAELI